MADYQQNFMNALQSGLQFGQQIKGIQDQRQLGQLAGQAYGAPRDQRQSLLGQLAQISPEAAAQTRKQWSADDQADQEELVNMARFIKAAPPEQQMQVYQSSVLPKLRERGMQAPDWTPETQQTILQTVDALVNAYGGGQQGVGVQSTFIDDQGNRVAILRDGTTQILGRNAPSTQIIEGEGGFYGVNKGNLQAAPVTLGGAPQPPGQSPQQIPGVYIDPSLPPEVQQQIRQSEMQGREVPSEMFFPAGQGQQLRPAPKAAAQSDLDRRIAIARDLGATPDQIRNMALGSAAPDAAKQATATEVKEATARRMKLPQLANLERGIGNIEDALLALDEGMIGTGPATARLLSVTPEGQRLETAVGAIQESLLSLTRVPGIGAQSDLEARIANLKYPQTGNYAQNNKMLIDNLRAIVKDIGDAYRSLQADDDAIIQSRSRQPQRIDDGGEDIDALLEIYR